MGTELDMEFQEAKARAWQKEVEAEIKDVNSLLEKINNTVATADPEHADDDFVKRINEVNENVTTQWNNLEKLFSDFNDKVEKMFTMINAWVSENKDRADQLEKSWTLNDCNRNALLKGYEKWKT